MPIVFFLASASVVGFLLYLRATLPPHAQALLHFFGFAAIMLVFLGAFLWIWQLPFLDKGDDE